jgi:hypothetical protein
VSRLYLLENGGETMERSNFGEDDDGIFNFENMSYFDIIKIANEDIINSIAWYVAELATLFGEQSSMNLDEKNEASKRRLIEDFLAYLKKREDEDLSFKDISNFCISELKEMFHDADFIDSLKKCVEINLRAKEIDYLYEEEPETKNK